MIEVYWILLIAWTAVCIGGGYLWGWYDGLAHAVVMLDETIKGLADDRRQKRAHRAAFGTDDTHTFKQ